MVGPGREWRHARPAEASPRGDPRPPTDRGDDPVTGQTTIRSHRTPPPPTAGHLGPRLVLVRGASEGRSFPLEEPAPPDGWLIGRVREAEIRLPEDPYVGSLQARVVVRSGRFHLVDIEANENTTMLNWEPMTPGGMAQLSPGDLIGVGMSLLVFGPGGEPP